MGSIPPLSLGPPVVRPLRMTVVRPFGNLTLMVLPHAGAETSKRMRSRTANFFTRVFSFVPGRCRLRAAAHNITDGAAAVASQGRRAWDTLGANAKGGRERSGTRDIR